MGRLERLESAFVWITSPVLVCVGNIVSLAVWTMCVFLLAIRHDYRDMIISTQRLTF